VSATLQLPFAHHLIEAVPFFVPAVLLPLGLLGLTLRDRLRERSPRSREGPDRHTP